MNTSTLFLVGLIVGAVAVFSVRAVSFDPGPSSTADPVAAQAAGGAADAHEGHDQGAASEPAPMAGPSLEGATVEVTLDGDGKVSAATMEMAGGQTHPISPGEHAPMGDFPAKVVGRDGEFEVHLHAHSAQRLELTLFSEEGDLIGQRMFEGGSAAPNTPSAPAASDGRAPENNICPVMGNEVNPDIYVDYQGRRIGFCCAGCDEMFLESPEKYLKKVDAEIAKRKGD